MGMPLGVKVDKVSFSEYSINACGFGLLRIIICIKIDKNCLVVGALFVDELNEIVNELSVRVR